MSFMQNLVFGHIYITGNSKYIYGKININRIGMVSYIIFYVYSIS